MIQTFNGGLTINGGTFTGSTGEVDTTNVTLTTGTLTAPSGTFNVSGNWAQSGGTFTPGSNTVTFTAAGGTQTINTGGGANSSFYSINHSGAGGLQVIANGLTLASGGTFVNSVGLFDLNNQSWTMSNVSVTNTGTIEALGGESVTGLVMDAAEGNVLYYGTSTYTGLNLGNSYYNITFNGIGGSWAATGPVTINGTLTITNGTYKANTHTTDVTGLTTVSGTGAYLASTQTQTLSGGLTVNGGTFTGSTGVVTTNDVTFSSGRSQHHRAR